MKTEQKLSLNLTIETVWAISIKNACLNFKINNSTTKLNRTDAFLKTVCTSYRS